MLYLWQISDIAATYLNHTLYTMFRYLLMVVLLATTSNLFATTWVDSLDTYAREKYLPGNKYFWSWQNAALLHSMVKRYETGNAAEKAIYLNYVESAMKKTYGRANGKTPNAVASGLGMAFLYKLTQDEKYLKKCLKIYNDYLKIRRTDEGAVSHLRLFTELWDDTVFMIGQYLLGMYEATGDRAYLEEFLKQYRLHRDKLKDSDTNLWVHGWDANDRGHCTFCSQDGWADKETRRSHEYWGRGNGWIVVTLSNALSILPADDQVYPELAADLKNMLETLTPMQDTATGHWYQLPMRPNDDGNYIESSCTAMFGFGISKALQLGIVEGKAYEQAITRAYQGLRAHSIKVLEDGYVTTQNVCKGTCIGDKNYYYKRSTLPGRSYAIGMFIQFGELYERTHGLR